MMEYAQEAHVSVKRRHYSDGTRQGESKTGTKTTSNTSEKGKQWCCKASGNRTNGVDLTRFVAHLVGDSWFTSSAQDVDKRGRCTPSTLEI